MQMTHNSSFPSIHQNSTLISPTCKMLYNRSLPSFWMTVNLLTLNSSKTEYFSSDLNNFLKYMTPLSLQPTLLATSALFLMNTLLSQTKSLHFLNPATITFVNFAVSAHISILDFKTATWSTIATSIVHSKLDYTVGLTLSQLSKLST